MFIRRALALVSAVLWMWPAGLHAQSEALLEAFHQGQALYEVGQYPSTLHPDHEADLSTETRSRASDTIDHQHRRRP